MANLFFTSSLYLLLNFLFFAHFNVNVMGFIQRSSLAKSTKFYDFKVQTKRITKLCKVNEIVTINGMYPGPVIYAEEDDAVIVRVTNESPYNVTIHWHGIRQKLSCWFDGPSYITQCPIQAGQTFTYKFTLAQQKGTFFWHAHVSWLRATVHGAIIVYTKTGIPYPFSLPFKEHIVILGEYWLRDATQLEKAVLAGGGGSPPADAFTINGHPGPNYNCSNNDVYKIDVVPRKTYLLRLINAALNQELFFGIANHKLTIVEADGEYTKPFMTNRVMLGPGQTVNVLVVANQPIGKYSMAVGPYQSAKKVLFQNITSIAYFNYYGAFPSARALPAPLPRSNDSFVVKSVMDGLRSLNNPTDIPDEIDKYMFIAIGLNVQKCESENPHKNCQATNGGVMSASMNNMSFVKPNVSLMEAYYKKMNGQFTQDFPSSPLKFYDFVNGAPNDPPNDTNAVKGTRTYVLEYGSRVQIILQDTGTITTENHPIHFHGYSFYVVGYGSGNYDPENVNFNLVDPPYMNTIGVPVGGWAAIRFTADNPGVWFMHCHLDVHLSWGLGMVIIVKNGEGPLESLPHPPPDMPKC